MRAPADAISAYIHAKDGNRPWLMSQAFTDDALLEVDNPTSAVSFPAKVVGRDHISEVLVRRFSLAYENVHTFCLSSPPKLDQQAHTCDWVVGMSDRESGEVRVGCGRYDWHFSSSEECLADSLAIRIETMLVLPQDCLVPIMQWLGEIPYPWCRAQDLKARCPKIEPLGEIARYIRKKK